MQATTHARSTKSRQGTRVSASKGERKRGKRKGKQSTCAPSSIRAGDQRTYVGVLGDGGVMVAVGGGWERAVGGRDEQRRWRAAAGRAARRGSGLHFARILSRLGERPEGSEATNTISSGMEQGLSFSFSINVL